jgi:hypothetical protein
MLRARVVVKQKGLEQGLEFLLKIQPYVLEGLVRLVRLVRLAEVF